MVGIVRNIGYLEVTPWLNREQLTSCREGRFRGSQNCNDLYWKHSFCPHLQHAMEWRRERVGDTKRGRYLGGGFSLSLRLGSHKVAANEEDERGYRRIYWDGRSIVNVHKTFHSFKLKPISRVWPRNSEIHQQIDLSYKILQWWLVDEREATVKDNEVVAHFPAILQNPGHTCTHAHGVISLPQCKENSHMHMG